MKRLLRFIQKQQFNTVDIVVLYFILDSIKSSSYSQAFWLFCMGVLIQAVLTITIAYTEHSNDGHTSKKSND
jgi:uncharacterized membrane protein